MASQSVSARSMVKQVPVSTADPWDDVRGLLTDGVSVDVSSVVWLVAWGPCWRVTAVEGETICGDETAGVASPALSSGESVANLMMVMSPASTLTTAATNPTRIATFCNVGWSSNRLRGGSPPDAGCRGSSDS